MLSGQGQSGSHRDEDGLQESLEVLLAQVNGGLNKHQRLHRLVVVKDSWTVENGFLTPTLKIKRSVIESVYGERLHAWSERPEAVLWQE